MANPLRHIAPTSIITGWDFSTGSVKCLAFDLEGRTVASVQLPTDLWNEGGVSEFNLLQLEGQARASTRGIAAKLRDLGRLKDWVAGGISATHHTAGRIDAHQLPVRRAICWNDATLAMYHARGLERLGGPDRVRLLIGGPWAIRYSLSHLVKDEVLLPLADWQRTHKILSHGSLAAGFLTGNFDVASVSSAASTGIMDFRTGQWRREMLEAISNAELRELAWRQLPRIIDQHELVGPLSPSLAMDCTIEAGARPLIFPSSDDQQAGLVGGGAVEAGQVAIILGNSAVVNSSSNNLPAGDGLDAMRLNWGPYLWMRCYNNGAQFLDRVVGTNPDWQRLEAEASAFGPGSDGVSVMPFALAEPSLGVSAPRVEWQPREPGEPGRKYRASLEALAYLIALGVEAHEKAGQKISRITVSGGIARSDLMCRILASVLGRPLHRLQSFEGPALGAAVTALSAIETHRRRAHGESDNFSVNDAVGVLVRFRDVVQPVGDWREAYRAGLEAFVKRLHA